MKKIPSHNRGFTLIISLVLLLSISVIVLSVSRTGLMEQRMFSNEYRTNESAQAAEAGLEYGIAWLVNGTTPVWTVAGTEETASPAAPPPPITAANNDQYNLSVTYTRTLADPSYVRVTSIAVAASDASSTATAEQYVFRKAAATPEGMNAPPLILDGCMSNVTGSPDAYPKGFTAGSPGTAIETSQAAACIDLGGLSTNGGTVDQNAFPPGQLWDYLFDISRAELQALADAEVAASVPDPARNYIWVSSTATYSTSWGSPTHPVVLVFDNTSGCPSVNGSGGITVYGIVFHDGDCGANSGWDALTVYGTLAINGDITASNLDSQYRHWTEGGGAGEIPVPSVSAPKLIGTWHDF